MARRAVLVALAILLSGDGSSPRSSLARIETMSVEENGVSAVLVGEAFGMAAGGVINFEVSVDQEQELAPRCVVFACACLCVSLVLMY